MNTNMWKYAAVTAGFVLSAPVVGGALRWAVTGEAPRALRRLTERASAPTPTPTPTVLHELELARLAEEVQRVRAGDAPGRFHRIQATTAAYDTVLIESCRTLGLPVPQSKAPFSDADRFDVESRLLHAGLRW